MHNFAGTREEFWARIETWAELGAGVAGCTGGGRMKPMGARLVGGRVNEARVGRTTWGRCWTWSGSTGTCSGAGTPTSGPGGRCTAGRWRRSASIAAAATVEDGRLPHSLHGYFLRAGRSDLPVILEVDRDRDGRSFSARHVNAVQEGEVIFSMVTSFHAESDGAGDDSVRRCAAARGARADGDAAGRLEPAARATRGHTNGLLEGCVHGLRVGACTHAAAGRSSGASSGADVPVGHRLGFRTEAAALVGPWRPVDRPLHVVPGAHPRRRLGVWSTWDRSRRAARVAATRARCAGQDGSLGATLYQEHLLLPGAMSELVDGIVRQEAEVAAKEGRAPRDLEELQRAHLEHPAGR